ncbi:MAG: hypothetical protein HY035_03305 [Nitrospirae bacterium]|nr:hypothetical protein [Nitrospirota bacterium]MBI3377418.1 hypothetical protein [Nitrospirota bacterium]
MLRNKDIRQLQKILLMRKIVAYLLVVRYVQLLQSLPSKIKHTGKGKEQEHIYEHKAETFTYDPVGNRLTGPHHQDAYTYNIDRMKKGTGYFLQNKKDKGYSPCSNRMGNGTVSRRVRSCNIT